MRNGQKHKLETRQKMSAAKRKGRRELPTGNKAWQLLKDGWTPKTMAFYYECHVSAIQRILRNAKPLEYEQYVNDNDFFKSIIFDKIYQFKKGDETFVGTQSQFRKHVLALASNVSLLIAGTLKSTKGWHLETTDPTTIGGKGLSEDKILEIRADPRKYSLIAKDYGLSQSTISDIKKRRTHAHIEGPISNFSPDSLKGKGKRKKEKLKPHHNCRAVIAPDGQRFNSVVEAAAVHNVRPTTISKRIRRKLGGGWRYA